MTVLVTGATGNVGAHVVDELRNRGAAVRAFVRDPARAAERFGADVEVAVGDFTDQASIRGALRGVDRVFLSSADGPRKVEHEAAVVDAAAAAGVALIAKASTVSAEAGSPLPAFDWNGRSEDHLRRSGVPATVLRSHFYMTNLLAAAEQVREHGRLVAPAGQGRLAMIDPRDVAAVAAAVLVDEGHEGRTYELTGPEAVSYSDVARELSRATGATIEYVDAPEDAARQGLEASGMPGWLVEHLVGVFGLIRLGAFARTTDTVRALTGGEPRSFAQFARDNATLYAPLKPAVG
jgi:uncharacterized protein YbjT (DUF2867 family)